MKKHTLVPILIGLLIGTCLLTSGVQADDASDAKDPTKERYCDTTTNADLLAQIKTYEDQANSLAPTDPQRLVINQKIARLTQKLKCSYRTIQNN